ncbi:MAG: AMIN domain-containing protein, partial [Ferrovum sp.]|nr:AMIN domain-containing protein [Ferrovum sp.]
MSRIHARFLLVALTLWSVVAVVQAAETRIRAVRLWPASEYTRVTFEAHETIQSSLFSVPNPDRLVLDLDGVTATQPLEQMAASLSPDDPYLRRIRVGRFKPGVVRVVFDLKVPVKASTALLEPVGEYGYRLILDIYPAVATPDPLAPLLDKARLQVDNQAPVPAAPPATVAAETAVPPPAESSASPPQAPVSMASSGSRRPLLIAV